MDDDELKGLGELLRTTGRRINALEEENRSLNQRVQAQPMEKPKKKGCRCGCIVLIIIALLVLLSSL